MKTERGNGFSPVGASRIEPSGPVARAGSTEERIADAEFDFAQLVRILLFRRKFIVRSAACGAIAALLLGLLIAPKYTATARIEVEPHQAVGNAAEAPLQSNDLVTEIDTHVTRLASRDHLRRVLESLSGGSPQLGPPVGSVSNDKIRPGALLSNAGLSPGEVGRRLRIWLGALAGRAPDHELDELERGVKVVQERTSRIISVSFTATSPERAAALANRSVELYVSGLVEQRRSQKNQELAALGERAAQLKSELDKATEVMGTLLSPQPPSPAGSAPGKLREARLDALQREAASAGQAYGGVLEREREIRGQQEVIVPQVSILSLASLPQRPSSANPILFTFPALIASLIGASLLAIILERIGRPLRTERDVADVLGLGFLGAVPRLPRSCANQPLRYIQNAPYTAYAESIKSALIALDLAQPHRRPGTVLISSSVQSEGKTTVATSLAVYAARLGRRVLLVDFDSRRPSTMRILRSLPQAPVSNVQDPPLDALIQHFADLHMDYVAVPQSNADSLHPSMGKHMQHFLRGLANRYDFVFIDGPPLLGITETRLLAAIVDSVIFVIKWGATKREVVQNAGMLLRNALRSNGSYGVKALALMTQVDPSAIAVYRYGDIDNTCEKYSKPQFERAKPPVTIKDRSHVGDDEVHQTTAGEECAS
jgi:Mrp family chromosome partitioning ATPase